MARSQNRLSQKFVASLSPSDRDRFIWDAELKGFFIRIGPGSRPVWGVRYRHEGKTRTVIIGPCHEVKAEAARTRATEIKQAARLGRDIVKEVRATIQAPTVEDLAIEHQLVLRPPRIAQDTFDDRKTHWEKHIIPALGRIRVRELSRSDIEKFHLSYSKQPSLGNRLLATLSKALNDCQTFRPPWRENNPSQRIQKFEEKKRQTILSKNELATVMESLERLRRSDSPHVTAYWLYEALLLSGLRLGELSKRKWSEIDFKDGTLFIPKAKNKKPRTVSLSQAMIDLLKEIPRRSDIWVFPSSRGIPFSCPQHQWQALRKEIGIPRVRLHDLRHTVASYAMHDGGLSQREAMELLGHSQMSTTERYLNIHDERKKGISDRASSAIQNVARSPQ